MVVFGFSGIFDFDNNICIFLSKCVGFWDQASKNISNWTVPGIMVRFDSFNDPVGYFLLQKGPPNKKRLSRNISGQPL
jgi:hypothetical protein